jgi:hypothetical protein
LKDVQKGYRSDNSDPLNAVDSVENVLRLELAGIISSSRSGLGRLAQELYSGKDQHGKNRRYPNAGKNIQAVHGSQARA